MKLKKILVTGSQGYIGAELVNQLIRRNFEVVGLDTNFFRENLLKVNQPPFKLIQEDIRNIDKVDLTSFDSIIHLAAISNDPMGELNPLLTEEVNYRSTIVLAKKAKESGVKRFIFSSSCSVYGISKDGIVDENSPVNPLTAYAISKIESEKKLQELADISFIVGILRNSTVYGYSPKFRNDLVVNNLTTSGFMTGKIKVMSDGSPWRPLIDVRDLTSIMIEFLLVDPILVNGKVINIGFNENNLQVKGIVDTIHKILPNCDIVYTGDHGSDSRSYKVKFDLFVKIFPHIVQRWPIQRSVKDLVEKLDMARNTNKTLFMDSFTRLNVLKELIKSERITNDLYWKD